MKELMSITANIFGVKSDKGDIVPQAELCFVMSEPTYSVDATGSMVKQRTIQTVRCATGVESLRKLAKIIEGIADECETEFTKEAGK